MAYRPSQCFRRLSFLTSLILLPLVAAPASAQIATMVADLNSARAAVGASSSPRNFFTLNGRLIFLAAQPSVGLEWHVSDGTAPGTEILLDSCPGECGINERDILGVMGQRLVWRTAEGEAYRLWVTDGTREGTTSLFGEELNPSPEAPVLAGDKIYFRGTDSHGAELWVADLSGGLPRLVKDIQPGPGSSFPQLLARLGSEVLFVASEAETARSLWRSDGSAAGTRRVVAVAPSVEEALSLGERVVFLTRSSGFAYTLWGSDGTAAGTAPLGLPAADLSGNAIPRLGDHNGRLYFAWEADPFGLEVWETDGSPVGTRRISHLPSEERVAWFPPRSQATNIGSRVLFMTTDPFRQHLSLWSTDGNPNHTLNLGRICSQCPSSVLQAELAAAGSRALLSIPEPTGGQALWLSDGTEAGTQHLTEACGNEDCQVSLPRLLNDTAYFVISQPVGESLWRLATSDPAPVRLSEFREGAFLEFFPNPPSVGRLGGSLFLPLATRETGSELWTLQATGGDARMVVDLVVTSDSSNPRGLTGLGESVLFQASGGAACQLYRSRGTEGTTSAVVGPPTVSCPAPPNAVITTSNLAFFMGDSPAEIHDNLWRTDGTPQGTIRLTNFDRPTRNAAIASLEDHIYLLNPEGESIAVWRSDGTVEGTERLFDLSGPDAPKPPLSSVTKTVGEHIYFVAGDEASPFSKKLWRTDGTAGGTVRMSDLPLSIGDVESPPVAILDDTIFFVTEGERNNSRTLWARSGLAPSAEALRTFDLRSNSAGIPDLVPLGDAVYFFADTGPSAVGLWQSDGTGDGTVLIREFRMAHDFVSYPGELTVLGNQLYFVLDDGVHGRELWVTDGREPGTQLVMDILPGARSASPSELIAVSGGLYFTADDGSHGRELWLLDEIDAAPALAHDIAPGPLSSNPGELLAAADRLYFSGDDGYSGRELWSLDLTAPPGVCQPSGRSLCLQNNRFRVEIAWRDFQNRTGVGQPVALTADTGTFWFFRPENVETIVKVLDGRGVNGHFWTFYGALSSVEYALTVTDAQTGLTQRYFNPSRQLASVGDTLSFGPQGASLASSTAPGETLFAQAEPTVEELFTRGVGGCAPASHRLCIQGDRFAVEASWRDFQGRTGAGTAVELTPDTGYFWFFNAANVEVVTKILDGRPVNGKFWLFYGALSNVEYTLTVTDTQTGAIKRYVNPLRNFASVADTGAF